MNYREHQPHPLLKPFVECYWTITTALSGEGVTSRVLPDACTDIIFTLGDDFSVSVNAPVFRTGCAYLVGVMTSFQRTFLPPGVCLFGIRFKPFGLFSLLGFTLQGTQDQIAELSPNEFSIAGMHREATDPVGVLNRFLLNQLNVKNQRLPAIAETIFQRGGNISVRELASLHSITERQIERVFRQNAGASVKEICKQVRFQSVVNMIRTRGTQSLLSIATDAGYYDHSHLLKEIKRYSGLPPSGLF